MRRHYKKFRARYVSALYLLVFFISQYLLRIQYNQIRTKNFTFSSCLFKSLPQSSSYVESNKETHRQHNTWDTIWSDFVFSPSLDSPLPIVKYDHLLFDDILQLYKLGVAYNPFKKFSITATPERPVLDTVYRKLDRIGGLQYIARFKYKQNDSFSLFLRYPLTSPCTFTIYTPPKTQAPLYVLVPYHGRPERLHSFLSHISNVWLPHISTSSVFIHLSVLSSSYSEVRNTVKLFPSILSHIKIVRNPERYRQFSRATALRIAALSIPSSSPNNSVLLHCDIDFFLSLSFLSRCRSNVIVKKQAYFPVFFSLFSHYSKSSHRVFSSTPEGYWRTSSYGVACISKSDFLSINPFEQPYEKFHHWGGEDTHQYKQVKKANLFALRAPDPGVVHVWHFKDCVRNSKFYVSCVKTNLQSLGHPDRLAAALLMVSLNVSAAVDSLAQLGLS